MGVEVGIDAEGDELVGVCHAEIGHRSSPSHCEATVTRTRRDGGQHCDEAVTPGFYQVTAARPVVSDVMPSQIRPTDRSQGTQRGQ